MESTNSSRRYSKLFTSGFYNIAHRLCRTRVAPSPLSTSVDIAPTKLSTTPSKKRFISQRRARPMSMCITSPSTFDATYAEKKRRRSSIISFSTRLFERVSVGMPSETANTGSFLFIEAKSEPSEVWLSKGESSEPSSSGGCSIYDEPFSEPIDPFTSSPESKSFFIDWTSTPPKRESFLSLDNSSPDRSFLQLPQFLRREYATSIQTMPIPPVHSRRSSFQYKPDKYDSLEEELWLGDQLIESVEWNDPMARIDWRQFHTDLIQEET